MGTAVTFPGKNFDFGPPPGQDEHQCGTLPVMADRVNNVSCWKLTPEELAEINESGCVFLNVQSGKFMFPVFVGSISAVNQLVADGGLIAKVPE
jgi:hypothetical protein